MSISPTDFSLLLLADDESQYFTDAGKTTLATDDDAVYVAEDRSGNDYDLPQSDAGERPTWKQADANYPALRPSHLLFDGSDHLQSTDPIEPGSGDFTFFLFFKPSNDSNFQAICAKGNSGSTVAGYSAYISGGTIVIRCGSGGSTNRAGQEFDFGTERLDAGEWISLAFTVTREGGSTTLRGYVNGLTDGWTNGGGGPSSNTFAAVTSISSADPFTLGAFSDGSGDLDSGTEVYAVFVADEALNAAQIKQLHEYYSNRTFDLVEGETTVFEGTVDSSDHYRIPAPCRYDDGSTDLIMLAAEARFDLTDDGDIDIVGKTSTNNGASWSSEFTIADNSTDEAHNPCLIPDPGRGKIHALYAKRDDSEANIIAGLSSMQIFYRSYDVGTTTWGDEVEITSQVAHADWRWKVPSPGNGLVLPSGRIIAPANHVDSSGVNKAHVIYSDDGGSTWGYFGPIGQSGANESAVTALPGGALLLASRNQSGASRLFSVSYDEAENWTDSAEDAELTGVATAAGLICVGNRIYVSAPTSSGQPRDELAVYSAVANLGRQWDQFALLDRTLAGYSAMVDLGDGTIGIAWEANTSSEDILFARFTPVLPAMVEAVGNSNIGINCEIGVML